MPRSLPEWIGARMKCLRNFLSGIGYQHVDYATRHHSRCYELGGSVGMVLLVAVPIVIVFSAGFFVGAAVW